MICSACSSEVPDGQRFCGTCGEEASGFSQAPTRRVPSGSGAPRSSSGTGESRFLPGTVLAGRYRIIGLLGKGGMGEVYRADDLKLGQAVALKFLPLSLEEDDERLARFLTEVRTARQVSHPNVCRMYDVGEAEGHHFLSMEYVDGEDLATLLRRIGRLPKDKAVQLSRQICAGLAAAHDTGILHRDLKPANIMVDGRGRARIADFGLAGLEEEIRGDDIRAGTPAYMSPEQLAGKEVTVRSDLYALGLVLYELFTGKPAFEASSSAELRKLQTDTTPASPSSLLEGFDPAVERVILRCLEPDPASRPASALAVAAALPGGDPLAAALAAGETPSPEMVAEAGDNKGLRPVVALSLLVVALGGMLLTAFLNGRSGLVGRSGLELSPQVLIREAGQIVERLGYTDPPADTAHGFAASGEYLDDILDHDRSPSRWDRLSRERPTPYVFWYRASPGSLMPNSRGGRVTRNAPPFTRSGMVNLDLDAAGRLMLFKAVPPQLDESVGTGPEPDWSVAFEAAGLDQGAFQGARPLWVPETYCDARAAWTGTYPAQGEPELRVEACAYRGRLSYFQILHPWDRPTRMLLDPVLPRSLAPIPFGVVLFQTVLMVGGMVLARRNLQAGRGDRRGARFMATWVIGWFMLGWVFSGSHVADFRDERVLFFLALAYALLNAALTWVIYIALEPFVRRRWPRTLVSWTRLVSGRFRDPLVASHVLIGIALGGLASVVPFLANLAASWFGWPPAAPLPFTQNDTLLGGRWALGELFNNLAPIVIFPTILLILLVLLRMIVRSQALTVALAAVIYAALWSLASEYFWLQMAFMLPVGALLVFGVLRFGVVAVMSGFFTVLVTTSFPTTLDLTAWYSGSSLMVMGVVAALAVYAFYVSLAGRKLLTDDLVGA
jgi:Protein kinase domain